MNYENHPCPHCGRPLRFEDDVVVCPDCATPQHRECWMENGHCVNEELHSSGYVWNANQSNNSKNETESAADSVFCKICGSENPKDALHCGNCGALMGEKENSENGTVCGFCGEENNSNAPRCKNCGAPLGAGIPFINENPYLERTGVAPDELIGGMRAGDIALYTQSGTKRYLPKFKRIANGKKLSFNFASFFFAPYWFFYRKLYKAGMFFIVLFACASLILSGFSSDIIEASGPYLELIESFDYENATEEEYAEFTDEIEKSGTEMLQKVAKPMTVVVSVDLFTHLLCALLADRLYYKKIKEDLKLIDDSVPEKNMRKAVISRRGGLSLIAFLASLMGYNSLVQLLIMGADMLMNSF